MIATPHAVLVSIAGRGCTVAEITDTFACSTTRPRAHTVEGTQTRVVLARAVDLTCFDPRIPHAASRTTIFDSTRSGIDTGWAALDTPSTVCILIKPDAVGVGIATCRALGLVGELVVTAA